MADEPSAPSNVRVVEFRPRPSDDIAKRLEVLLEAARRGEIVALVVGWEYLEGGVGGWWELEPGCRPTNLLGQLQWLSVKLATKLVDTDHDGVPVEEGG